MKLRFFLLIAGLSFGSVGVVRGESPVVRPLADVHIHYSHDAWEMLPAERAVQALRDAGLAKAFVSSSSDEGTQMLFDAAPDLVVPVLRPYRKRGEIASWLHDDSVLKHIEDRLSRYRYAGLGEFHAFGDDVDLPVMQRVIELAREHGLFLHAHSDREAVERIFAADPEAIVLWAHSGFEGPEVVREMLGRFPNLWADLAFRTEHAPDGTLDPVWRQLFLDFPERFLLGTDTFTPERWHYVADHAAWCRQWLSDLPDSVAEMIARENAESLLAALKS